MSTNQASASKKAAAVASPAVLQSKKATERNLITLARTLQLEEHHGGVKITSAELAVWLARHSILVTLDKVYARYGDVPLAPAEDEDGRPLYRVFKQFSEPRIHRKRHTNSPLKQAYDDRAKEFAGSRFAEAGQESEAAVWRDGVHHGTNQDALRDFEEQCGWKSTFSHSLEYLRVLARQGHFCPELPVPVIPEPAPHHQPAFQGSSGVASAKTQIPEKKFKAAERPSRSMQDFWNKELNACEGILWQDRHGNLSGTRAELNRRTTQARVQDELDKVMLEKFQQRELAKKLKKLRAEGVSTQQLIQEFKTADPETIRMLMIFELSKEEAAQRLRIEKESVMKAKQRARAAINQPIISEAINNTKPQDPGWYIVIKLKSRPPYLVRLDMSEDPTADQEAIAIWSAKIDEENRLMQNKLKKIGVNHMTSDGDLSDLTKEGVKVLEKIRPQVSEAFEQGMIFYFAPGVKA